MKMLLILFLPLFLFSKTLTIYNDNLAYITAKKEVVINNKEFYIYDLPRNIIKPSLRVNLDMADIVSYEFKDRSFTKQLLKKNLNKEVDFIVNKKIKRGKLIKIEPIIVIEDLNKRYYILYDPNKIVSYEDMINNFSNLYLKVKTTAPKNRKSKLFLSYLVNGLRWKTSYFLELNKNRLNLDAFVEIDNKTDKNFKEYKISLVSGSLNRRYSFPLRHKSLAKIEDSEIKPKKIDSFYVFDLPFNATIKKDSRKIFKLFGQEDIQFNTFYTTKSYPFNKYSSNLNFQRVLEFKTLKVLPKGEARVYKNGVFLGEDFIENSPKNSKIKLSLSTEFDLKGKKIVKEYINKKGYKKIVLEYQIKNSASESKNILINEHLPKYFASKIEHKTSCKKSCKSSKKDAFTYVYKIKLKPNSSYKFDVIYEAFD